MSTGVVLMNSADLWSLADADKFERWLIDGELREVPMTLRNPRHGRPTGVISYRLEAWCRTRSSPGPVMFNGDIFFRLRTDPDTNVGVDVALATPAQVAALIDDDTRYIDGPPLLAVEVLSGSDTMENIDDKIAAYLDAGTPVLWIVDPFDQTVTVYRPGAAPVLYNREQELSGDPELPGFRCPVAEIFLG